MNHNFITKILLAFGLLACAATAAYAVKAYPYPITVTQPDGTTITIQIHGDEFLNWTTSGNRLVEQGPDGFYYYASFNSDGTKSISKSRVTANPLASAFSAAPSTVRPPQSAFAAANERRQSIARIGNPDLATGKHRFLVMLIEFSDIRFTVENPQNQFHRLLNEVGYSDNGATGSSYDYYYGNSKGVFDPSFDVIGPITLEKTQSYYGDDGAGGDRAYEALADACKIADAQNLVDFSVYDQDKNGTVDNIFFFFAGSNQAEGGGVYTIWPHQWQLFEYYVGVINLDGVSLNTSYACTSCHLHEDFFQIAFFLTERHDSNAAFYQTFQDFRQHFLAAVEYKFQIGGIFRDFFYRRHFLQDFYCLGHIRQRAHINDAFLGQLPHDFLYRPLGCQFSLIDDAHFCTHLRQFRQDV